MKFVIAKGEAIFLGGNPSEITIRCEKGILWITRAGDVRDYILKPGEAYAIEEKGDVAIIGQRDATVSLIGKSLMLNMTKQSNVTRLTCLRHSGIASLSAMLSPQAFRERVKSTIDQFFYQAKPNQRLEACRRPV